MDKSTRRHTMASLGALAHGDLANADVASTPGGIEAQESAGQATFCLSATLPIKDCPRKELEAMGVKFGGKVDDLFLSVTLPAGWKKQATDHAMWSDLLDDKGRKRAAIFYKAAFYDRSAHMHLLCRYGVNQYSPCDEAGNAMDYSTHTHMRTMATDCGNPLWVFGVCPRGDYENRDALLAKATAWLDERYPEWRNPTKYWD